ncbi:hypothetical protein ACOSQ4_017314 [Xanthoceras sorbifolium]
MMSFISKKIDGLRDEIRDEIRASEDRTRRLISVLRNDIHAVLPGVPAAPRSIEENVEENVEDNVEDYGEDTLSDMNCKIFEDFIHKAEEKVYGDGYIYVRHDSGALRAI